MSLPPIKPNELEEIHILADGYGAIVGRLFERGYTESNEHVEIPPTRVRFNRPTSGAPKLLVVAATCCETNFGALSRVFIDRSASKAWRSVTPLGYPMPTNSIGGVNVYFARVTDLEKLHRVRSDQPSLHRRSSCASIVVWGYNGLRGH